MGRWGDGGEGEMGERGRWGRGEMGGEGEMGRWGEVSERDARTTITISNCSLFPGHC
ncbi:MAG: hypothetical protein WBA39_35090 [Rivularia sp. (in: cyanobacteria)]